MRSGTCWYALTWRWFTTSVALAWHWISSPPQATARSAGVFINIIMITVHHPMSLRSCALTDIGFYDFAVRRAPRGHRRAVPEAHEFFDERVWDATTMMIRSEREEQRLEATPRRIRPADVELMSPCLGKGGSSTAYLCRLRFAPAQTFVVKVPNPVASGATEYVSDEQPGALPASWRGVSDRTISFAEYERELRTMEWLLEPDEYVQLAAGLMTSADVRRLSWRARPSACTGGTRKSIALCTSNTTTMGGAAGIPCFSASRATARWKRSLRTPKKRIPIRMRPRGASSRGRPSAASTIWSRGGLEIWISIAATSSTSSAARAPITMSLPTLGGACLTWTR